MDNNLDKLRESHKEYLLLKKLTWKHLVGQIIKEFPNLSELKQSDNDFLVYTCAKMYVGGFAEASSDKEKVKRANEIIEKMETLVADDIE